MSMDKLRLFILVMSASYLVTQIKSNTTPNQKTIICFDKNVSLECPEDTVVNVVKALYRGNNQKACQSHQAESQGEAVDAKELFLKRCLGEKICKLHPTIRDFDVRKTLGKTMDKYNHFEIEFNCCSRCPVGTYGCECIENCKCRPCHCQGSCHRVEGQCETKYNCTSGWYGKHCNEECPNGKFGLNCSKNCNCQDICDKVNGSCPTNCEIGRHGIDCQQECLNGTFGQNCLKDCHCQDVCDKVTGSCPSHCESGWHGIDCQDCADRKFGLNCSRDCHCQENCEKDTGVCPSHCEAGWQGIDCQEECSNGKFGPNCNKDCHCEEVCDKVDGSCPAKCENGWQGIDCQQENKKELYTKNMDFCHCKNATDICGKENSCASGCQPGWSGSHCRQPDCSFEGHCGIHICQEFGRHFNCSCLHGYENSNPRHCKDIDECGLGDVCDIHTCRNKEGSYECTCRNDSYVRIAPQICVEFMKIDLANVKTSIFSEDIKVLIVVFVLSTWIIAFFAVVAFYCANTVVGALYRYITTEPCGRKVLFVGELHGVVVGLPLPEDKIFDIRMIDSECERITIFRK